MPGAAAGGFNFWLSSPDVDLGELKATPHDVISAFVGSMSRNTVWQLVSKRNPSKVGAINGSGKPASGGTLAITLARFPSA